MTWSYDSSIATDRDEVRFLVGDTDTNDQQLANEEIAYLLTQQGSVNAAAIAACRRLAAKYARQADFSNSKISVSASQRAKAYAELASQLEREGAGASPGTPFVGGLTLSGNEALAEDTDAVQPTFSVGMDDLPGTARTEAE